MSKYDSFIDVVAVEDLPEGLERGVAAERCPVDLFPERRRPIDQPEIAQVHRLEDAFSPELLEEGFVLSEGRQVRNNRLVRDDEVPVVHRAVDGGFDALLEVRDQIARITAEDLVSALTPQDHFPVSSYQLGNHVLRECSRPGGRIVHVVSDALHVRDEVFGRDRQHLERESAVIGQPSCVGRLVVLRPVIEPTGKPEQPVTMPVAERGDDAESNPPLTYAPIGTSART